MSVAGAGPARCALVADDAYPEVALALVDGARRRCLVSMFILDMVRPDHPALLDLVDALGDAAWRGVDTRVVVGGSRQTYQIAATASAARAVLSGAAVPVRWLAAAPVRGSHAKVLVADDHVLLGSHNWSPGSFSGQQIQDSVVIGSAGLAGLLHTGFEEQWRRAVLPR